MHYTSRLGAATFFAFLVCCPASALAAPAAQKPTAAAIAKPVVAATVAPTLKEVKVPAALKQVLGNKRKFEPATLSPVLSYVANIPQLQVAPGRVVVLEPVVAEPPILAKARPTLSPKFVQRLEPLKKRFDVIKFGRPLLKLSADHRSVQTPIRDQGARSTCVAHASIAALEAMYKRAGGNADLSENHAYNIFMAQENSTCTADPGIQTWKAAGYLTANLICEESESPYVSSKTASCATIPPVCSSHRTHGYVTTEVFFSPAFGGTGSSVATNTAFLESLLDQNLDIVMGFYVAGNDWSDGTASTGAIDVQVDAQGNPAPAYGGHAMLLVGYNNADNYFIAKNSWGADRGHAGYYYLTYEYVQTYAKYGFAVTAVTGVTG